MQGAEDVFTTPDIRYVREALYQTARHGGFMAVIGESGAGKSTLRRDLIERINRENAPVVVIEPYIIAMVWKVSQRDREIFLEFDGRNHHELARKFGVSLQWIYSVVKRVKREELDRMQGKLFDGEPDDDAGTRE